MVSLARAAKPDAERFAVENGKRSGGRGSGRPRRISLKNTHFRRNDGSSAFEIGQFQKQQVLGNDRLSMRSVSPLSFFRASLFQTRRARFRKAYRHGLRGPRSIMRPPRNFRVQRLTEPPARRYSLWFQYSPRRPCRHEKNLPAQQNQP